MNHSSICRTTLAAFVIDAISVSAAFQSASSNDLVVYHPELGDFCLAQHVQLLPWPAYSSVMSPIELAWDLVGRLLARYPLPAASKDKFLLCMQAI
ncbi:transposable element Tcb2 transposase [Trichonephila clavipes]|nr:transposable element Tcb2 transposase [Trichonephila clavipes]